MLLFKAFFAYIALGALSANAVFGIRKKAAANEAARQRAIAGESRRSSSTIPYHDLNFVQSLR